MPQKIPGADSLLDYEVKIEDGTWCAWKKKVPQIDIDPKQGTFSFTFSSIKKSFNLKF